jgi:putative PIN family toxin of toxin-antitoxin system
MKNSFFVIDTNTLISAILFEHSNSTMAFDKVKRLGKIPASFETYNELCDVIVRPKFDRYVSLKIRLVILNEIKGLIIFQEISESIQVCRDPKDNKFLELAIAANASCIITGDKDLLVLHPFRNVPILNAVDFIDSF